MMTRPPIETLMNRKNESLRSDWRAVVPRDAGFEYAADPVDSAPSCAHRRAEDGKEKGAEQRKPESMVVILAHNFLTLSLVHLLLSEIIIERGFLLFYTLNGPLVVVAVGSLHFPSLQHAQRRFVPGPAQLLIAGSVNVMAAQPACHP